MAKFNRKSVGTKTVNKAGGEAYKETPKLAFVSLLLTSFVNDKYYRSAEQGLEEMRALIAGIADKQFLAKAAIYARNEFGMRSITHAVAGEIVHAVKGEVWVKAFLDSVIRRVDDVTEIVSYYLNTYKKPIPNSLKKGVGRALRKFDAYQLAKYRGEGHALSLVDVFNLCHPKPDAACAETWAALMKGTLKSTETWEAQLAEAGQKGKTADEKLALKAGAWAELISERKLGYFALLRNLRNIMQQAPGVLPDALKMLVDQTLISKSLVLPFRYQTALKEIEKLTDSNARKVMVALNKAVDLACENVSELPGRTCVVLDESGSMQGKPFEIGSLFAAILVKANNADLVLFTDDARYLNVNPLDSTTSICKALTEGMRARGTDFDAPFRVFSKPYDRLIFLSDMQGWIGFRAPTVALAAYSKKHTCAPKVFSFDLAGYGTLEFPENNIYCLAGFSDKVFDVMRLLEEDRKALVKTIEAVPLERPKCACAAKVRKKK